MFAHLAPTARERALEFVEAYFWARACRGYDPPVDGTKARALTRVGVTSIALWPTTPDEYFRRLALHSAAVAGHTLSMAGVESQNAEMCAAALAILDFALGNDDGYLGENRQALSAAWIMCTTGGRDVGPEVEARIDDEIARPQTLAKQPLRLVWEERAHSVNVRYWLLPSVADDRVNELSAVVTARGAGDCVLEDDGVFLQFAVLDEAAGLDLLQPISDAVTEAGAELSSQLQSEFAPT